MFNQKKALTLGLLKQSIIASQMTDAVTNMGGGVHTEDFATSV